MVVTQTTVFVLTIFGDPGFLVQRLKFTIKEEINLNLYTFYRKVFEHPYNYMGLDYAKNSPRHVGGLASFLVLIFYFCPYTRLMDPFVLRKFHV